MDRDHVSFPFLRLTIIHFFPFFSGIFKTSFIIYLCPLVLRASAKRDPFYLVRKEKRKKTEGRKMKAILLNSLAIEYPTERCAEFSNLHEFCRIGEERVPTDFQEIDDIRGTRCTGWSSRTGHLSEVSDFTRARRSSAARLAAMSEEQLAARPVACAASCQILRRTCQISEGRPPPAHPP